MQGGYVHSYARELGNTYGTYIPCPQEKKRRPDEDSHADSNVPRYAYASREEERCQQASSYIVLGDELLEFQI
jgi:hypothetical protein